VTAVAGPTSLELVKSLGATAVFDYTRDDFPRSDGKYDVIVAPIGRISYRKCMRSLTEGGRYVQGDPTELLKLRGSWTSWTSSKQVFFKSADEKTAMSRSMLNFVERRLLGFGFYDAA
jgi:NADPH:quinone reductase-like Zn-dependent oxidoreductase